MILVFLLALIGLLPVATQAATIAAASCSAANVNTAIGSSANGDTVTVPAGSCTWATQVAITKSITLQGNGVGSTIITDGATTTSGDSSMILLTTTASGTIRITGFSFIGKSGLSTNVGMIATRLASPVSTQFRIDNNYIETQTNGIPALALNGCPNGLVDHNTVVLRTEAYLVYARNGMQCNSGGDAFGDEGWAVADPFGSVHNVFIEDNQISAVAADTTTWIVDSFDAGRYVLRFNSVTDTNGATTHGISSGGRHRGGLNAETYGNTFQRTGTSTNGAVVGSSSGSGISFNNVASKTSTGGWTNFGVLQTYREANGFFMWGKAGERTISIITRSGTTATATTSAVHGIDLTSFTGTYYARVTGATGGDASLYNGNIIVTATPTTSTFTYTMAGTPSGSATGTLLLSSPWDGNTDSTGYPALDQPGYALGTELSDNDGGTNTNACCPPAYPASGLSQTQRPWYSINNTNDGALAGFSQASSPNTLQANRDWYNETAGFDGTVGAGRGVRASRPSTCTTGVAYWSTDQGSWNQSSSNHYGVNAAGADGVLDKCTATNTWTNAHYTPYTYPHPLQGVLAGAGGIRSSKGRGLF